MDEHEGCECVECGDKIGPGEGRSSPCGSIHAACMAAHAEHCEACAGDE